MDNAARDLLLEAMAIVFGKDPRPVEWDHLAALYNLLDMARKDSLGVDLLLKRREKMLEDGVKGYE